MTSIAKRRASHLRAIASVVAVSLGVSACGGGESANGRVKNAALGGPIACAVGGSGPSGGRVLSLGATPNDDSIEVPLEARRTGGDSPANGLAAANAYAAELNAKGPTGWAIPTKEVLEARKADVMKLFGADFFWSTTEAFGYYWVLNIYGNMDISSKEKLPLLRALPFRTFKEASTPCMPPPTTTVPATTTTLPVACAQGGLCAVGDTGPGGGLIVSASSSSSGPPSYLEFAPDNWWPQPVVRTSVSPTRVIFAPWATGNDAARLAGAYRGGGKSDWRLPTAAELMSICATSYFVGDMTGGAWSTDTNRTGYSSISKARGSCYKFDAGSTDERVVRPVRTNSVSDASYQAIVAYYAANPTTTTSTTTTTLPPTTTTTSTTTSTTTTTTTTTTSTTTTTIPRTTTTSTTTTVPLVRCTDISSCELGQAGPGGGRIIYADTSGGSAAYWEMAPSGWSSGSTRDPLISSSDAPSVAGAYRGGGFSNWVVPPEYLIDEICRVASGIRADATTVCVDNTKVDAAFGNGSGARGSAYYWNAMFNRVTMKTDLVSGRNLGDTSGSAYLRPVRQFTYVPPTTTTTIAKTCAAGGRCAVGDISPAGNLIVSMLQSGSVITYVEIPNKDWAPELRIPGNNDDVRTDRETGTSRIARYSASRGGSWRMGTLADLRAAFVFFETPKFNDECVDVGTSSRSLTYEQQQFRMSGTYWTIDPAQPSRYVAFDARSGAVYYDANRYYTAWGWKSDTTTVKQLVRPFRTVTYTGPDMSVPAVTWSPAKCENTSPPTTTVTTTPVGCKQFGRCNVGDIGPNNGIIIYVNRNVTDGPEYTEMAAPSSSSYDCNGTASPFDSCTTREWNDGSYRVPFGQFPTSIELAAVVKNSSLRNRLNFRSNGLYWTNMYIGRSGYLMGDFTGNLKDLGSSLELRAVDTALAINMTSGMPRVVDSAYFRGVTRWKCRAACAGW